jgi:hypothetical protein
MRFCLGRMPDKTVVTGAFLIPGQALFVCLAQAAAVSRSLGSRVLVRALLVERLSGDPTACG